jgi:glycosyltransferase involved in cell wall biosynthesis
MNVLIVTDAFPPGAGGSGRSTAHLARALLKRNHRVRVVVGRASKNLQRQSEWEEVPVSEVELPESRFGNETERARVFAAGLSAAAGEEAWDLTHAQHWLSAAATHDALPRLPSVVTVRDYWPVCAWSTKLSGTEPCPGCSYSRRVVCVCRRHPFLWPAAPFVPFLVGAVLSRRRRHLAEASAVISVSRYVARQLEQELGVRSRVVPNFVDADALDEAVADAHPSPAETHPGLDDGYVLFVGKLEANKAPDLLIPVLEEAKCNLPLVVAGTGALESELRSQAARASRDVRFLGWVPEDEVLHWTRHASAVLFPSRWQEPLSRVLLDALGLGAVLVVEPTGGTEDLVVDGKSGLAGTGVSSLAAALRRVLDEPGLSRKLRDGAKRRARENFSESHVMALLESVYQEVTAS